MSDALSIGLVCPYSFAVPGGVQAHVLDLAAHLEARGHRVRVLAPGDRPAWLPDHVTTVGRPVPMPYNGSVARVSFGPLVAAGVRRWLAEGHDVLHIHEPATPSVSVLALWATRSPVVATYHTAQQRTRALETSAATFLRNGLAKIDAHVAVSGEAQRTLRRYLDVPSVVIPNGIETGRFPDPAPARAADDLALVFVGRLDEPRKGLHLLLAAFPEILARHPRARLRLVGGGSVRGLLRRLPPHAARRIDVVGPVDDTAKARVLADADLLVAPNTHGESFGIVLLEAMASSTAVVASDLPAFRKVLEGGRLGALFAPGDLAGLVAAVGHLADPGRRTAVVRAARQAVDAYDWQRVTPRLLEQYAEVAVSRSLPATG